MRSDVVEVLPPPLDDDLGLAQRVKDLAVQQFVPQPGVEALDVAVLPRAARLDIGGLGTDRRDPAPHRLGNEFRDHFNGGGSAQKIALERDRAPNAAPAPRLHPNLAELYRQKVVALQDAFKEPATRDEAIGLLRGLLERVTIVPQEQGLEIELVGDLARMIALPDGSGSAGIASDVLERSVKVVAGTRNRRGLSIGPVEI